MCNERSAKFAIYVFDWDKCAQVLHWCRTRMSVASESDRSTARCSASETCCSDYCSHHWLKGCRVVDGVREEPDHSNGIVNVFDERSGTADWWNEREIRSWSFGSNGSTTEVTVARLPVQWNDREAATMEGSLHRDRTDWSEDWNNVEWIASGFVRWDPCWTLSAVFRDDDDEI